MDYTDRGASRKSYENFGLSENLSGHFSRQVTGISNILALALVGNTGTPLEAPQIRFIYSLYENEIDLVLESDKEVKRLSRAPIWAACVFAAKVNPDKVVQFLDGFFSGAGLTVGAPALILRNQILNGLASEGGIRTSLFKNTLTALKYFMEGEKLQKLYMTTKGYDYFLSLQKNLVEKIEKYLKFPDKSTD